MRVVIGAEFDLGDYQDWLRLNGAEILSPLSNKRGPGVSLSYRTRSYHKKKTLIRPPKSGKIVATDRTWRDVEAFLAGHPLPNGILPIEAFALPDGEHQICADASLELDRSSQRAAWAGCLLRQGKSPVVVSGKFARHNFRSSGFAEIAAVANTISKLVAIGHIKRGDRLRVFSDCRDAVKVLSGQQKETKKSGRLLFMLEVKARVDELADKHDLAIRFAWVKGHQPRDVECYAARANQIADRSAVKLRLTIKKTKRKDAFNG